MPDSRQNLVGFGTLGPDGEITNERAIRQADVQACPHVILIPEHYREDGGCRCDDQDHQEMAEWGYTWNGKSWTA